MKKLFFVLVVLCISFNSKSQSPFTRSGTTIYPAISGDKIGLGTTTSAEAFLHLTFTDNNIGTIIQPSNYGVAYAANGPYIGSTAGRFKRDFYSLNPTANSVNGYTNRPDVVGTFWGYNVTNSTGREATTDGSFDFSTETDYWIGSKPYFEFHIPRARLMGATETEVRLKSIYFDKLEGIQSFTQNRYNLEEWFGYTLTGSASVANGGFGYANLKAGNSGGLYGYLALNGQDASGVGGQIEFGHGANGNSRISSYGTNLQLNQSALDVYGSGNTGNVVARYSLGVGDSYYMTEFIPTKALFQVVSTSRGSIPAPKMTALQRNVITNVPEGLMVYNSTTHSYEFHNGTVWTNMSGGGGAGSGYFIRSGTTLYPTTAGDKIGLGTTTSAEAFTHYNISQSEYPIIIQPTNYGTSYAYTNSGVTSTTADRFYMGGYDLKSGVNDSYDHRPDVTASFWAYNSNANAGRINSNDAAFRFATETALFYGGPYPHFAFHLPEVVLYNGTTVKTSSIYQNKSTGIAQKLNRIDAENWYSLKSGPAGLGVPIVGFTSAQSVGVFGDFSLYGEPNAPYGGRLTFSHGNALQQLGNATIWGEGGKLVLNSYALDIIGVGSSSSVMAKGFVGIGGSGNPVDFNRGKAMLEIQSTTKGSLPAPRMTSTQRDAITAPPEGLMIYNFTTHEYNYYNGTEWVRFCCTIE